MPVRKRVPKYCHHKATGQAYVKIDGQFHYLGEYGSEESKSRYRDEIDRWMLRHSEAHGVEMTVGEMALLYWEHVERHYRKNGRPTSEQSCIKTALRYLNRYQRTRVADFSPLKLKRVRDGMIRDGICRESINKHVGRIRRCFKWAVDNEYCSPSVLNALEAVQGLRAGRTDAVETEPVAPVPDDVLQATTPHMPKPFQAMLRLQVLTGMHRHIR